MRNHVVRMPLQVPGLRLALSVRRALVALEHATSTALTSQACYKSRQGDVFDALAS